MNCRYTRVDWNEIRRTIRAKLENLPAYRDGARGRPVWLLYYGEGDATGRLPGPDHNAQLIEFLKGILAEATANFDAVWWADEVYAYGGPTLYKAGIIDLDLDRCPNTARELCRGGRTPMK
jgi:hypothetical protein